MEGALLPVKMSWMNEPEIHIPRLSEQDAVKSISPRTEAVVLIAILIFLYLVRIILLPFVIAGAIAFVFAPAVDWLAARLATPRWVAATVIFLLLLGLAILLGSLAGFVILQEFVPLVSDLKGSITRAARGIIDGRTVDFLGEPMNAAQIGQKTVDLIGDWLGQGGNIFSLAGWGFAGLFGVILLFVLLFYFLVGGSRLARAIIWLAPPNQRRMIQSIWIALDPILRRYFIGIGVVVVYAAIAAYLGLGLVLGLRHATLLAIITGVLEMLPVIGPALSALLAGLVAIQSAKSIGSIAAYALYAIALRLSIDQLVGPVVLGHAAQLHPVQIIFCFLAGGLLFGIPGVILAVPLALAIKVVLATLYAEPLSPSHEKPRET